LEGRIYANIVQQFKLQREAEQLQQKLKEIDDQFKHAVGAMNVLADLYGEETGQDLRQLINSNTDKKWKALMEKAQKEASSETTDQKQERQKSAPPVEEPQEPVDDAEDEDDDLPPDETPVRPAAPALRSVSENRQIKTPAPVEPKVERSRPPVRVVIDDSPPRPPVNGKDDD
jgi:hypothetical protein